jgi:integrase
MKTPWQLHKELKLIPTPDYKRVVEIASEIPRLDVQALFILGFLTGGRVMELIGNRKPSTNEWLWRGLLLRNINVEDKFLVIKLHNAKYKKLKEKVLYVPIEKEKELLDMLEEFLNLPCFQAIPNEEDPYPDQLFTMNKHTAYAMLKKNTGYNPHFLRVMRATDLCVRYNLNNLQLVTFMGWASANVALTYVNLNTENMKEAMLK